jgi:2-polyprenyl-3-methyl-5-hydroxy-6-metoxy-1,4-benzoquinol methylase
MHQKIDYLVRSVRNFNQPRVCPNCGAAQTAAVDSKYFITHLLRCANCKLQFRHPTDTQEFLNDFYQSAYQASYSSETRSITDLPDDATLARLMRENFPDKRNHTAFIYALLKTYAAGVLDYGCSWGYSVYHLKQAGYDAEGFEISRPRAEFGHKLGVNIHYRQDTVPAGLDMVMSNHAIEHVPVISDFVRFAASRLKTEGLFMAFCPNGSAEYRKREPGIFHVNWGFLHPNYLDVSFAAHLFRDNPYLILTGDWNYNTNILHTWDGRSQLIGEQKDGKELLIVAKPNINIKKL